MYSSTGSSKAQTNNSEEDDEDASCHHQTGHASLLKNHLFNSSSKSSMDDLSTNSTLYRSSSLVLDNLSCNASSSSYFRRDQRSPSVYRSHTSLSNTEDPWKASSIGIKCVSYKPTGHVFLTRRVLDTYATDGRRKIDICYNYSKRFASREKVPSIGTSIKNCSFCDTITLDVEPCAEVYDIVMEVQIITQGASLERQVKLSAVDKDGAEKKKETNNLIENYETCFKANDDNDEDSDSNETTTITSNYDFKIRKTTQAPSYDETNLSTESNYNDEYIDKTNDLNASELLEEESIQEGDEESNRSDMQKIIIKTVIRSAPDVDEDFADLESSKNATFNFSEADSKHFHADLKSRCASDDFLKLDKHLRSLSSTSLFFPSDTDSAPSPKKRRAFTPEKLTASSFSLTTNNNNNNKCSSLNSSKRSIVTTVEFYPPVTSVVSAFDLNDETIERAKFFNQENSETDSFDKAKFLFSNEKANFSFNSNNEDNNLGLNLNSTSLNEKLSVIKKPVLNDDSEKQLKSSSLVIKVSDDDYEKNNSIVMSVTSDYESLEQVNQSKHEQQMTNLATNEMSSLFLASRSLVISVTSDDENFEPFFNKKIKEDEQSQHLNECSPSMVKSMTSDYESMVPSNNGDLNEANESFNSSTKMNGEDSEQSDIDETILSQNFVNEENIEIINSVNFSKLNNLIQIVQDLNKAEEKEGLEVGKELKSSSLVIEVNSDDEHNVDSIAVVSGSKCEVRKEGEEGLDSVESGGVVFEKIAPVSEIIKYFESKIKTSVGNLANLTEIVQEILTVEDNESFLGRFKPRLRNVLETRKLENLVGILSDIMRDHSVEICDKEINLVDIVKEVTRFSNLTLDVNNEANLIKEDTIENENEIKELNEEILLENLMNGSLNKNEFESNELKKSERRKISDNKELMESLNNEIDLCEIVRQVTQINNLSLNTNFEQISIEKENAIKELNGEQVLEDIESNKIEDFSKSEKTDENRQLLGSNLVKIVDELSNFKENFNEVKKTVKTEDSNVNLAAIVKEVTFFDSNDEIEKVDKKAELIKNKDLIENSLIQEKNVVNNEINLVNIVKELTQVENLTFIKNESNLNKEILLYTNTMETSLIKIEPEMKESKEITAEKEDLLTNQETNGNKNVESQKGLNKDLVRIENVNNLIFQTQQNLNLVKKESVEESFSQNEQEIKVLNGKEDSENVTISDNFEHLKENLVEIVDELLKKENLNVEKETLIIEESNNEIDNLILENLNENLTSIVKEMKIFGSNDEIEEMETKVEFFNNNDKMEDCIGKIKEIPKESTQVNNFTLDIDNQANLIKNDSFDERFKMNDQIIKQFNVKNALATENIQEMSKIEKTSQHCQLLGSNLVEIIDEFIEKINPYEKPESLVIFKSDNESNKSKNLDENLVNILKEATNFSNDRKVKEFYNNEEFEQNFGNITEILKVKNEKKISDNEESLESLNNEIDLCEIVRQVTQINNLSLNTNFEQISIEKENAIKELNGEQVLEDIESNKIEDFSKSEKTDENRQLLGSNLVKIVDELLNKENFNVQKETVLTEDSNDNINKSIIEKLDFTSIVKSFCSKDEENETKVESANFIDINEHCSEKIEEISKNEEKKRLT